MNHLIAVLVTGLLATPIVAAEAPKPNIIFILADDLGIGNVSCYGADHYKTPNIDRLASGGTRYARAYTAPLCGPSRTLIMTGRYAFRTGATNQDRVGRLKPSDEVMLPSYLKAAGYVCSAVGKWNQLPLNPDDWGFDDYLRFNGSGVYRRTTSKGERYSVNGEQRILRDQEYMPDLMHQHVVNFLGTHKDDPFFIYYSLSHVHGTLVPTPDSAPDSMDLMADNVAYMDKLVGKLIDELDRLQLRQKTLVIFVGDNGTGKAHVERSTISGRSLSGQKGSMRECGALVPMVASWPGTLPAGAVSTDLIDSTDFVPTFAELAGAKLPTKPVLDGHSFAPQLRDQHGTSRDWIFIQLARQWYVRDAGWKLNQSGELFDMSDAPFTEKLVNDRSDPVASAARERLQAALDQLNPAGGILDDGDGTGRHANKAKKKIQKTGSKKPAKPANREKNDLSRGSRPNVLFIAVDDLRPELGCYGNAIVKSPNIDRLAARGLTFNRAYCQQAVCSPSRTSLLTGRRPDATQVWDLQTHFRVALPDAITLPQHFKANGYHCAALGKIYHRGFEDGRSWSEPHWYPNGNAVDTDPMDWTTQIVTRHGINVTEYLTELTVGPLRKSNKRAKKGPAFEVSSKSDDELPDGATAAEAVRRLHELKSKEKPFFLAVGFLKPHLPFVAPQKYWDLYDSHQIPVPGIDHLPTGAPEFAGHTNGELHNYPGVPTGNPIPDEFAKTLRHGYYACISYTDAQVGRLLDALDEEGLADNTVIVFWGDHGWQLGDHGLWHKHTNFELATRVPLLISVPHQKTAGQRCQATVEFVDVYPTLADVCGLPIPAGLDGSSLRRFLEDSSASSAKVAISQYPRSSGRSGGGSLMGYSIRDDRWRLTLWRERAGTKIVATELYDELNDPAETVNLADDAEYQATIESLSKHLPQQAFANSK